MEKKRIIDNSKNKTELVFTEKTPCTDCKPKEETIKTLPYTQEELELAMTLINKVTQTADEMKWLISLNNRALRDKKQFGCGKCNVQVMKNIRNLYKRHMNNL
jgi:hypothetical protein